MQNIPSNANPSSYYKRKSHYSSVPGGDTILLLLIHFPPTASHLRFVTAFFVGPGIADCALANGPLGL
jgi:hypothetical protein